MTKHVVKHIYHQIRNINKCNYSAIFGYLEKFWATAIRARNGSWLFLRAVSTMEYSWQKAFAPFSDLNIPLTFCLTFKTRQFRSDALSKCLDNAFELAIRNVKVKTKVSGQFRNDKGKGADRYARIRSVVDTNIKNGQIGRASCRERV